MIIIKKDLIEELVSHLSVVHERLIQMQTYPSAHYTTISSMFYTMFYSWLKLSHSYGLGDVISNL